MHGDVRQAKLAEQLPHLTAAAAHIVHDERADDVKRLADDLRAESVDGYPDTRMLRRKDTQRRLKPAPLLLPADGVRSRTGGACTEVKDVRSRIKHIHNPSAEAFLIESPVWTEVAAARENESSVRLTMPITWIFLSTELPIMVKISAKLDKK